METHIKAMLHNVTMYCSSGVETEITKFLFFPLKRKSCNTEAEYICLYSERERETWSLLVEEWEVIVV